MNRSLTPQVNCGEPDRGAPRRSLVLPGSAEHFKSEIFLCVRAVSGRIPGVEASGRFCAGRYKETAFSS